MGLNYKTYLLDALPLKFWKTQANFLMIQPPVIPTEFEARMLEEGVMVRPLGGFGGPQYVRVTIGTRTANEAFINGLKKILT